MPTAKFTDEKFIIVVNKNGGEDTHVKVIPLDSQRYGALQQYRPVSTPTMAEITGNVALSINSDGHVVDVPLSANTVTTGNNMVFASDTSGNQLALHPSLYPLLPVWEAGDMAINLNMGILYQPVTDNEVWDVMYNFGQQYGTTVKLPRGIRAHDTGQLGVGSMNVLGPYLTGWAGRIMDAFQGYTNNSPFPGCISWALGSDGISLSMEGLNTSPVSLPGVGASFIRTANASYYNNYLTYLDNIASTTDTLTPRQAAWNKAWLTAKNASAYFNNVNTGSGFQVDQYFGSNLNWYSQTHWQYQFRLVARSIETRAASTGPLSNRSVFMLDNAWYNYDSHSDVYDLTRDSYQDWAMAIACFRNAMIALGVWNDCLVIEMTEFGRNMPESGATSVGVDHGWGWNMFMVGGQVAGKGKTALGQSMPSTGLYGSLPAVYGIVGVTAGAGKITEPNQIDSGAMIPQISWEQVLSEPLRWFGCDPADLTSALPNRANFPTILYNMTA